jgi:hypothetical protein
MWTISKAIGSRFKMQTGSRASKYKPGDERVVMEKGESNVWDETVQNEKLSLFNAQLAQY